MNWNFVEKDIYKLYGKKVEKVEKLGGYGDKFNFTAISSEDGEKLVFKVKFVKSIPDRDETMNQILLHLTERNFTVPKPCVRKDNISNEDIEIMRYVIDNNISKDVCEELITFVPGSLFAFEPFTPAEISKVFYNVGTYVALMNKEMQEFNCFTNFGVCDEAYFFIENCLLIRDRIPLVDNKEMQEITTHYLNHFEREVFNNLHAFRRGVIHGDFNDLNMTVLSKQLATDANQIDQIKSAFGAFDFEDGHFGYYVFELATCMMYCIAKSLRDGHNNPWECGGQVLAGYNKIFPLTKEELDALFLSVASRFCVSLIVSYTHAPETIDNNPLLYVQSKMCPPLLRDMFSKGRETIMKIWMETIGK